MGLLGPCGSECAIPAQLLALVVQSTKVALGIPVALFPGSPLCSNELCRGEPGNEAKIPGYL